MGEDLLGGLAGMLRGEAPCCVCGGGGGRSGGGGGRSGGGGRNACCCIRCGGGNGLGLAVATVFGYITSLPATTFVITVAMFF